MAGSIPQVTARGASLWEGFIPAHGCLSSPFLHIVSDGRCEGASVSAHLPSQVLASQEALPGKVFIDSGPGRCFFSRKVQGGCAFHLL